MSISRLPGRQCFDCVADVGVVDSSPMSYVLLEPICDLSFREPGTDQLVSGFSSARSSVPSASALAAAAIVGEIDRGSHPLLLHQDANYKSIMM